jgi:hypothetical protein
MNQLGFLSVHGGLRADSTLALSCFYTILHKWDAPLLFSQAERSVNPGDCTLSYNPFYFYCGSVLVQKSSHDVRQRGS